MAVSFVARLPTTRKLTPAEHAQRGADAKRRAQAELKQQRARGAYLRSLTDFERELLEARCPLHTNQACCDQCVEPSRRDSTGFPGIISAGSRGRYRLCPECRKLAGIDQWNFEERLCSTCRPLSERRGAAAKLPNPAAAPHEWRITRR